jgi:hypothetical protein
MATFGLDDDGYPPVDSDEFLELQMRSKLDLDKLIDGYQVMQRGGEERVDHAKTQERRNLLRQIMVRSNIKKNEDGVGLIYWDKILKYARLAVEKLDHDDIQRGG